MMTDKEQLTQRFPRHVYALGGNNVLERAEHSLARSLVRSVDEEGTDMMQKRWGVSMRGLGTG